MDQRNEIREFLASRTDPRRDAMTTWSSDELTRIGTATDMRSM
jgi:hypothetical protein